MKNNQVIRFASHNWEAIALAVREDHNLGFCVACGCQASNVEPDAREYMCIECNEPCVYGAEELLFYINIICD